MRPQNFPAETEADGEKDQGVEHAKQGHQEENLNKNKKQCRGRQLTVGRVERSSKLFVVTGVAGEGEGLENILYSQNLLDFKVNIFFCTHCIAKFSNSIEPYPIIPLSHIVI